MVAVPVRGAGRVRPMTVTPLPRADDGPALLDALDARPRRERAISADGVAWLTVGQLLDRARAGRAADASATDGAVAVPGDDPVEAVCRLLAAQAAGQVPVVGPGGTGDDVLAAAGLLTGPRAAPGEREPLLVVVTSGSSGRPRAVVRTARSWQLSLDGFDTVLGSTAGPGTVVWAPGAPSATLTLFALWHALATGRPVVAPGPWHGSRALASGAGVHSVQCVPAVLRDVVAARETGLLPHLRRAVVAGAATTPGLLQRARAAGVAPARYYGAAELSFVAADGPPGGDPTRGDPTGGGLRAFPGVELAVRDGEIWARSPYLARGYLGGPDGPGGPGGVPGPLRVDDAGWASVGDLGELTPDGVLVVRGRGDGTATVGGVTVTLADVELALGDVPGVAEVVALAEPDGRFGERVLAVVRPVHPVETPGGGTDGGTALVATLRAAARRELPAAARPVRYVVRAELPRLAAGKVARSALLAQVRRAPARTLGP